MGQLSRISSLYFLGILVVIAVPLLISAKYDAMSSDFTPTTAIVTKSSYIFHEGDSGEKLYKPVIVYKYNVDAREFTNDVYSAHTSNSYSYDDVQNLLSNYSQGANITIYYNPKSPDDSLIIKGTSKRFNENFLPYTILSLLFVINIIYSSIPELRMTMLKVKIIRQGMTNKIDIENAHLFPETSPPEGNTVKKHFNILPQFRSNKNEGIWSPIDKMDYESYILGYFGTSMLFTIILIGLPETYSKFRTVFGLYDLNTNLTPFLIYQIVMFYILFLIYLLHISNSLFEAIVLTLASPVLMWIALFASLVLVLAVPIIFFTVLVIALGILLTIEIILFPFPIILTPTSHFYLFLLSFLVGLILYPYLEYLSDKLSLVYSNFSKGVQHYNYAYSDGIKGITTFVCAKNSTIFGDMSGNITLLNEYSMELPEKIPLHSKPVVQVALLNDDLYSISDDQTLKITTLAGPNRLQVRDIILESIPTSLLIVYPYIIIGTSEGNLIIFKLEGSRLQLEQTKEFAYGPIISLKYFDNHIYFASGPELFIVQLKNFELLETIERHDSTISDLEISEDRIITSSLQGKIRVSDLSELKNSFILNPHVKDLNEVPGITSLLIQGDILFAGSTNGILYKVHLSEYKVSIKDKRKVFQGMTSYKIHNFWINDIKIHSNSLYTISSDATLKVFYLE